MKNLHSLKLLPFFAILFIAALPANGASQPAQQSAQVLTISPITNEHHKYCLGILELALSYSGKTYRYEDSPGGAGGMERELVQLKEGIIDVVWTATSEYMETEARAIRIPLYRGLLGHRILLIRQGEQKRFDDITTLEELKTFTFGQGDDWPDTAILRANGFKVVPSHGYENLFFMLDGGRFDAFPRGVFEPWSELKRWRDLDLEVEQTLAISYKMPLYLFVAKDNIVLAKLIESGLNKAIEDGSFDNYFFNHPIIEEALTRANMHERKIFHITNPNLPPDTPLENSKLWWSPLESESSR